MIKRYIGEKDIISRDLYTKMELNDVNNDYYKYLLSTNIVPEIHYNDNNRTHKSNKILQKSFDFFSRKVSEKFKNRIDGESVSKFIETISTKLFFTILTVDDETNAYILFETLNSRGTQLASIDLLKNFLFSKCSDNKNHLMTMQNKWNKIVENLKDGDANRFIRMDWGTRNQLVPDKQLFKKISKEVVTSDSSFKYIEDLEKSSEYFYYLSNITDNFWNQNGFVVENTIMSIESLNILRVKQVYGLLIAYLKNMEPNNFHKLLSWVEKISFRYNTVSKKDPKEQESVYNKLSMNITSKNIKNVDECLNFLKDIYIGKEEFVTNFQNFENKNKKIIKYILNKINEKKTNNILDMRNYSIEHILCENKNSDWDNFDDPEEYLWRIGNLTLLRPDNNNNIANIPFVKKLNFYKKENIFIVENIIGYNEWNVANLEKRQKEIALLAQEIWKIDELEK